MILKEALEIQHIKLMSFRAENALLKKQSSGLFPGKEKDALERCIRQLEPVIKTNDARREAARSHWKPTERIRYNFEI